MTLRLCTTGAPLEGFGLSVLAVEGLRLGLMHLQVQLQGLVLACLAVEVAVLM